MRFTDPPWWLWNNIMCIHANSVQSSFIKYRNNCSVLIKSKLFHMTETHLLWKNEQLQLLTSMSVPKITQHYHLFRATHVQHLVPMLFELKWWLAHAFYAFAHLLQIAFSSVPQRKNKQYSWKSTKNAGLDFFSFLFFNVFIAQLC